MPNFEESARNPNSVLANDYSYSKLLAFVSTSDDHSTFGRANKVSVVMKDTEHYNDALQNAGTAEYREIAGCDMAAIFMPFQSRVGSTSGMPGFYHVFPSGGKNYNNINLYRLLPFEWASGTTTTIKDRWASPSGDSINDLVSSDRLFLDNDRYRDTSDLRGIGLRLPAMGIGWGFTTDGDPWPSGSAPAGLTEGVHYPSGARFFKGGKLEGYDVDPSDYIAAPIDIRYDKEKNLWVTVSSEQDDFWIQLLSEGTGGNTGWYTWKEIVPDPLDPTIWNDASPALTGVLTAREINDRSELANTVPARYLAHQIGFNEDGNPVYIFSAGTLPVGQYQHQLYGMVVTLGAGWELPLAVPDLDEVEI